MQSVRIRHGYMPDVHRAATFSALSRRERMAKASVFGPLLSFSK